MPLESRPLVQSEDQIVANVLSLHAMASGTPEERRFHARRVKNGKVFVAVASGADWLFAPSRFCGYVDNGLHHLHPDTYRHGSETNVAIRRVLAQELGPNITGYRELDSAYLSYCSRHGIFPSLHELPRRYWIARTGADYPDEADCADSLHEGALKTVRVNRYERDSRARQLCILQYGTACTVCGFDFEEHYGARGRGFTHVHHLVPLHTIRTDYVVDPIKDLRPVCPNCHAMLHRGDQCLTIEELQAILVELGRKH